MGINNCIRILSHFPETELEREGRIQDEILVDTYSDEEITASWHSYLEEYLNFPFTAMVRTHQSGAAPHLSNVRLVAMAPLSRCAYWQMWVLGRREEQEGALFHFFLSDLTEAEADPERIQALADWNYWRRDQPDEMWEE